ncbi:MAG: DNA alkylation repair protein [Granulosicoccus sp.]|nr:DNA alkylation repair protein [Granulosicoccus sp.]
MVSAKSIKEHLQTLADPTHQKAALRFFKTGEGEYGAGDHFIGIRMPVLRQAVVQFYPLSNKVIGSLLKSPIHEVRLFALLMLVRMFELGSTEDQENIATFYLANLEHVNNWDLVDASCYKILGPYLYARDSSILFDLARSSSLWERRVAIVTTFHFIRQGDYQTTFALADILLNDAEDLIHKACGWMLRNVGDRDGKLLREYLTTRYKTMPRTMLRYSIEKFPGDERRQYLDGEI